MFVVKMVENFVCRIDGDMVWNWEEGDGDGGCGLG